MRVGFLGLGLMGTPMTINLARKFPVAAWNRSPSKYSALSQTTVKICQSPRHVLENSDLIFMMLLDSRAVQSVVDKDFRQALKGKTIINTASVSVDFSQSLAEQVQNAGGKFVEMPVSGGKVPAEQGQLIGMMAGDEDVVTQIRPYIEPITKSAVYCGPIGSGLKTKYAVNAFLVTLTAGLAESLNLARAQGIDLGAVGEVLNAGPLSSAFTRIKIAKVLQQDWSAHGAISVCYDSTRHIQSAAQAAKLRSPLLEAATSLFREANDSGLGEEDMMALYKMLSDQSPSLAAI